MVQITLTNRSPAPASRFATLRDKVAAGVKWWAEHQAWPATDEIRIERRRSTCG